MTVFIILIIVLFVGGVWWSVAYTDKKKKKMEDKIVNIGFKTTQKVMSCDGNTGIAIDETSRKICLINNFPVLTTKVLSYGDIISSEIIEDSNTVTKTQRGSQLGGAVVGGLLLGGVGAVVGGLSGKKKTETKVRMISLKVIINDTASPVHIISFLDGETKKTGFVYSIAMQQATHWHALLSAVVRQADD